MSFVSSERKRNRLVHHLVKSSSEGRAHLLGEDHSLIFLIGQSHERVEEDDVSIANLPRLV
jgi:hypothetical protein